MFGAYLTDQEGIEKKYFPVFPSPGGRRTYKSFVHQVPCDYNTQAMTDARKPSALRWHITDAVQKSHGWERFGRLMAERFDITNDRAESFMFKTGWRERYRIGVHATHILNTILLYHISSYLGIADLH